jgi:isopentenyl diphosphate isomerase/L-lactate dehydrogenase-like FMN-dependent dehydrogenase
MNVIYHPKLEQPTADLLSLDLYAQRARDFMPEPYWAFIDGGVGDEISIHNNRHSFDAWQILPRMLVDFSGANTRTRVLGQLLEHPILLAPVGYQRLVHPQGELASADAAEATDTLISVSTQASQPLAAIAARVSKKWFQLYWQPERHHTRELIRKAEALGYQALVITVDAPVSGLRIRSQLAGFQLPYDVQAVNVQGYDLPGQHALTSGQSAVLHGMMADAMTWADVQWVLQQTALPVVLKGVLHPDDALHAQQLGVAGLVVSNHGGRTLDGGATPLAMLPAIRKALGDDFTLILDGGIRRGTDVFKALALGANAVMIGRPIYHGLAVAGALGVAHQLQLLRNELEMTMALAGIPVLADLGSESLLSTF